MRENCLAFLVLIVLGGAISLSASPSASKVTGTVLDPSGGSTPETRLTLKHDADKILSSVQTDVVGKFTFNTVAEGDYSIEVGREGSRFPVRRKMEPLTRAFKPSRPCSTKLHGQRLTLGAELRSDVRT